MKALISEKLSSTVSVALFFFGMAGVSYLNYWWPGSIAILGISYSIYHLFLLHIWQFIISLIFFSGWFAVAYFRMTWIDTLPYVFILSGIYVIVEYINQYKSR